MRINYDFNDLQAFLAVMEFASFQQASEHLNTSQSAITRRIRKLENALGTALFERTTRSVKPTLAAKHFRQRAVTIVDEAQEATAAIRDESAQQIYQQRKIITIAAVPSAIPQLLTQAIRQHQMQGYDIRMRILDCSANEVVETVARGEADFGISSIPSMEQAIDFELIAQDRIVLVTRKDQSSAFGKTVNWSDLCDKPLILPAKGTGNRMLIDDACAHNHVKLKWLFEVKRTATAIDMVKAGLGIAAIPASAAADSSLQAIELLKPQIVRPIGLVTRNASVLADAVEKLMDCLRS